MAENAVFIDQVLVQSIDAIISHGYLFPLKNRYEKNYFQKVIH